MKRRFRIFPVYRQDGTLIWGLQWDYGRDKKRKSFVGMGQNPGRLMNQALRIAKNHAHKSEASRDRQAARRARGAARPPYPEH